MREMAVQRTLLLLSFLQTLLPSSSSSRHPSCIPFHFQIDPDGGKAHLETLTFLPSEDNVTRIAEFIAQRWQLNAQGDCATRECVVDIFASALANAGTGQKQYEEDRDHDPGVTAVDHLVIAAIPKTGSRALYGALRVAVKVRQADVHIVTDLRKPESVDTPDSFVSCPHFSAWNMLVADGAFTWYPLRAMRFANASLTSTREYAVDDDDDDDDDDDAPSLYERERRVFWRFARECDAALTGALLEGVLRPNDVDSDHHKASVALIDHIGFLRQP